MTKYQAIISKIQAWQKDPCHSSCNLNLSELELITNALETIQVLEIILRLGTGKEKLENHV